ncbi:MAG TPA: hypothetical protein PKD45_08850 [Flavobacteriales bacterium]|nr:hypothetical protein [Flavobacteriales bacterium]
MRTKNFLKHLILGALLLTTTVVVGQSTTPGNVAGGPGDFLGWENNPVNNFPLEIRHDLDQPIDFWTTQSFRARINPRISYPIGLAPNAPRDGFMLLSGRDNFPQDVRGPFTRLHLVDDVGTNWPVVYAQDIGYRQWMRNGITFTGNSDQAYIGQKYNGNDNTDFVIQWSDNPETQEWGTDRMKFIFSSEFTGDHTGMGSEYGLEAMRFWPRNANEVNVGVGDFYAYGGDPTERLHVRDGRVRIQQLPTDPAANTLNRFMVVDNTGVVKWRHLPPWATNGCEWEMNTSSYRLTTARRPAGTNGNCPDERWKVGIGTPSPQFKMEVVDVERDTIPTIGGLRVDLRTNHGGWRYGVKSYLEPKHGGVKLAYGAAVQGDIVNAGLDGPGNADAYGVLGRSTTNEDLYLRSSMGVTGTAINSSGTINELLGGDFFGANTGGTVTATYGVRGRAYSNIAGAKCYGVHGTAPVDTNSWAGYFQGKCVPRTT